MKLPNSERAIIEREKILDYLLNPAHPDNGGKAQFFFSLGFRVEEWQALQRAFINWRREAKYRKDWNRRMGRSILWTVVSSRPAAVRQWCERFGL